MQTRQMPPFPTGFRTGAESCAVEGAAAGVGRHDAALPDLVPVDVMSYPTVGED